MCMCIVHVEKRAYSKLRYSKMAVNTEAKFFLHISRRTKKENYDVSNEKEASFWAVDLVQPAVYFFEPYIGYKRISITDSSSNKVMMKQKFLLIRVG